MVEKIIYEKIDTNRLSPDDVCMGISLMPLVTASEEMMDMWYEYNMNVSNLISQIGSEVGTGHDKRPAILYSCVNHQGVYIAKA